MEPVRSGPLKAGDTLLDKYEVRRLIGSGGHAFVYECFDMFLSRVVAIKVIKSGGDNAANIHARARTEAQLLVRIDHQNLVKVIDAGVWQGLVYIVMEYLEGRNLREVLRDVGRISVAEALTIGFQIAAGMAYAHGKRVIHRDLKPENIFVLVENATKVLDFGIAKVRGLDGLDPKTTQPDMVQGTWLYMSPEHLQGHPVSERSDIFALGTMLFEALHTHPLRVGEEPVGRDQAAWMQMFKVPPLLSELDPTIPRYVAKVIHRALLKVPSERYTSMQELKDALFGALQRHLQEDVPKGLVVTRQLYQPQAAQPQPAHRNTLRAAPVLTNQVTVKAPPMQSGHTEPMPPISPPRLQPVSSASGRGVGVDVPAKPARVTPARSSSPPSSDQPTIWVQPSMSASSARVSSPAPVSRRERAAVTPGTPPPVATRAPLPSPSLSLVPWLQDRSLKFAAIAAALFGVIGGTAYGVLATNPSKAAASAAHSAATAIDVAPVASHQDTAPPAPASAVESAAIPAPPSAPQQAAVAVPPPETPAPRPSAAPSAARISTTPPHPATKVDVVDSGLGIPSLDEVHQRFEELDRKTKSKPAATAAKPAPTSTAAPQRPRQTVF